MNDQILKSLEPLEELWTNTVQYIDFDESSEAFEGENFQKFTEFLSDKQITKDKNKMKIILYIISAYYQDNNTSKDTVFLKISRILLLFKENLSDFEIFRIFETKSRLILYFYEKGIVTKESFNKNIVNYFNQVNFLEFFYIELRDLNLLEFEYQVNCYSIEEFINENDQNIELFKERRRKCENESKLSQIIRKDSVDDFTSLVSQTNLNLNSTIELSFFEPMYQMTDNIEATLIEYAAFYGSQSIFKYLMLHEVRVTKELFLFAIYGRNYDIIHLIEDSKVHASLNDYVNYFNEAIKCHHNEIAVYFEENNLKDNIQFSSIEDCVFSFNIPILVRILENNENCLQKQNLFNKLFFDLCEYGYIEVVSDILNFSNKDLLHEKDQQISNYCLCE